MSDLSQQQFRHGLAQMLRSYSTAGVKHILQSPDVVISPDWQNELSDSASASSSTHSQTHAIVDKAVEVSNLNVQTPLSLSSTATSETRVADASSVSRAADSASEAHARVQSQEQPPVLDAGAAPSIGWSLPQLSIEERQQKLSDLNAQVVACRKCEELVCYRRQTVFGEGHLRPRVCFFGEAPGADEDAQGRPFVGAAGRLLSDIIRAMKLNRDDVYILNSLKCRPPQNRTPLPEEIENCRPYALTQLAILQPEYLILLGAVAVRSVLQSNDSVGRLRGRFHQFHGAKVLVTYHPAYLLRQPEAKRLVWTDVQMVMRDLQQ